MLTHWERTPSASDGEGRVKNPNDPKYANADSPKLKLRDVAHLASWQTPQAMDASGTGRAGRLKKDCNRNPNAPGSYPLDLKDEVLKVASWQTPNTTDGDSPGTADTYLVNYLQKGMTSGCRLRYQAQLSQTDSGTTPNGSTAPTKSTGQLNPAFSRWLQGLPEIWDVAGIQAMRKSTRRRKVASVDSEDMETP